MKKTSVRLTEGNIAKLIISFALPIFAGQIFQNLYNSVDAIVVGNYVGTTALAAVSSSADISMLLTGFFTGLSTGAGVLFARYFGAGDDKNLHDSIHTAITFALSLGAFMATLGIILAPLLLKIVNCPDDVFAEASMYLRVYLIGILFTAIYNVGAGILRAVGDSRSPFIFLVIASFTNIILDLITVVWLKMGVMGVAVATVVSQAVSVTLVFRKLMVTNDVYKVSLKDLGIRKDILLQVIDLGIPAAIQASLTSISNLFVQRYINSFGSAAMAGIGAAKKIDRYVGLTSQSLGLATTTFVSQNYGAKKLDRAFKGIHTCLLISGICVAVAGIPTYFGANTVIRLFTNDPEAITYGISMMHTMLPLYYCQTLNQIFSNAVRGFGKSRVVMVLSLIGMIGMRQLWLAVSMSINYKVENVFVGFPIGWFFSAVFVFIYYYFKIRKPYKAQLKAEKTSA